MELMKIERLDHLGVVGGVIKDLSLIELIDARIPPSDREEITTGQAIAAMILNGLGFSNRPISLTPQFFENKPVELLFGTGVMADHFNRFKLGRSLDKVFAYGCDLLFSEIALSVCGQEGIACQFNCLDTTSFSLYGDYVPETDEQAIAISHGYSKDHRPDLKQAILELVVSQDGGVPIISKSWDGNAGDNTVFKKRCEALIEQFSQSELPRHLIADSKLYTKTNAPSLGRLPYITRIPETIKAAQAAIEEAWAADSWRVIDERLSYYRVRLSHYGIDQRWLVVYSQSAEQRANQTIEKAKAKEWDQVKKQLFHLQAQRFESETAAQMALNQIAEKWKYHRVSESIRHQHIQYAKKGRPTVNPPIRSVRWQIRAQAVVDDAKVTADQKRRSCFVIGTSISDSLLTDKQVIEGYQGQSTVERGFRFLKDSIFFVSSLFVKKPSPIEGLLMVMTLALLVYSVAQRRMRHLLAESGKTLPNQIGQPQQRPTLRWIFQLLEGINHVVFSVADQLQTIIVGLTDLRRQILQLFGQNVCQIYHISFT